MCYKHLNRASTAQDEFNKGTCTWMGRGEDWQVDERSRLRRLVVVPNFHSLKNVLSPG